MNDSFSTMTIELDELTNVTGAQLVGGPAPVITPDMQRKMDQQWWNEMWGRVSVAEQVKKANPWLTIEQSQDPDIVARFMRRR